jgi:hypothetical protein
LISVLIRVIIHSCGLCFEKGEEVGLVFVCFSVECVSCPFYLYFLSEVEEAFPTNHEELFDFPNHLLSLKREPYKLEPDTQELGSTCLDNEGTSQVFGFCIIEYIG